MLDKKELRDILEISLENGGYFADIFIENKNMLGIKCEGGEIEKVHSGIDVGAGIRVINGEDTSYAYTNDLSYKGLKELARVVSKGVNGNKGNYEFNLTKINPALDFKIEELPSTVDTRTKADMLKLADKAAKAVNKDQIKQVVSNYSEVQRKVIMANSLGEYVEDERIRTRFAIQAIAGKEGRTQTGYESLGGVGGFELMRKNYPEQLAKIAANRAVKMLSASLAPSGKMTVVMAGEAGGTMIHEACGHGLEADLVQKKLSVYAGKKGEIVANKDITVIDDATMPNAYGSYVFDDEGIPSKKVTLIKNGILQDFMYDRLTASKEDKFSNGHGRRESYKEKPIPRMANTYIAPGKENAENILKQVKKGLLVKKMGGGQVNTTTGDFVFEVSEGYLIEYGEIKEMVRGATLTGNGPKILQNIEMVGSDLGFSIGVCGKEGQGVPVSDAQPTLLLNGIIVGGTA